MSSQLEELKAALAGRYEIEREIGHGGMATVYLARDVKHKRQVAVKVLRPDLAAALGADRFVREIEIAANLTHPHILPLYDSGEADGFLYYVMPYIEGDTLRQRIEKEGELPVGEAVRIIREVVDALAFAHSHGVVHRDIKPDNVMLSGRHAMVTDFGVAKAISEATGRNQLTTAGVALGTPAYMSPEQATADPHVDHRADIYAVGAMAYELLTGRVPFVGATPQAVLAAQVTEEPDPVSKYRDQVPSELETVVMKCLAKKPADRFQTAEEMLPYLETVATSGGMTPTATQPHQAQKRAGLRHPAALAVGAALVLASAFMFWRGFGTENESGLDPNVLLVAPFDVFDPDLEDVWREGMAQTVSHILDGAGPLRSVPTSVVMRGWNGTADVATATAAAARLGAGLALFGRLVGAGGDSVRLSATLLDVGAGVAINDFNVWGSTSGAVHLADSLAVLVMAELSRSRSIAVAHLNSLGSSSPPALKAFLQAEQHYRRFALDSARFYYTRAIELDTTFALAYNHLGWASSWTVGAPQPIFLRAAALNHGLSRRESLVIQADSFFALGQLADSWVPDSVVWANTLRHDSILRQADEEYPDDPFILYRLGEMQVHREMFGRNPDLPLETFSRVV
ncbi:MAG: serine/threonine-protein kinase, partial [Gemmatimonadetes bacterium]|nr:serine/threonine-protein kinase [Gemmatimonadota bacterium]